MGIVFLAVSAFVVVLLALGSLVSIIRIMTGPWSSNGAVGGEDEGFELKKIVELVAPALPYVLDKIIVPSVVSIISGYTLWLLTGQASAGIVGGR